MSPFTLQRLVAAAFAMSLPNVSCFTTPNFIIAPKTPALSAHNSHNGRRDFIQTTITSVGTAIIVPSILPSVANARSGDSSNIVMPSYIDYLIEKNAQGQEDTSAMLYKGPDIEIQLRRIGEAALRLPEVSTLAEEKKWSQVQGIISGPLGTLLQTMNSIASIVGTKEATNAAKLVKTHLFEIGAAAGKKDSATCIKAASKAEVDLEKFVKIAFK
mmetsp:Transcript_7540/g.17092  ORF Transcript_7540/g.17092 Transcript_7540/m.17092 type:complete len:215 (-) Transcript_7540:888-1532(-)